MGRYQLSIELEGVPPLNSADNRHWRIRQRDKEKWFEKIWAASWGKKPSSPLKAARVTIVRCSSQVPDADNLHSACKFLLDALGVKHGCGIIEDDKPATIGMPIVRWEKASPKQSRTRIFVEEVSPDEVDSSAWDYGEG